MAKILVGTFTNGVELYIGKIEAGADHVIGKWGVFSSINPDCGDDFYETEKVALRAAYHYLDEEQ